jgi:hypothetical protein
LKLSTESIQRLDQLVQTSLIAGIKKLVIENDKIRGIDEKQSVVIITKEQVPDLQGKQIGITRIEQLSARLNLVKSQGDLQIDATESNGNAADISLLDISAGKTKAQFRAASVEAVKGVPKNITDDLVWEIKVTSKLIPTLTQGISAMGAELVTLASRDGTTVSFECVDANKDVFTMDAEEAPVWVGDGGAPSSFCQKYPAKTFIALMKEAVKFTDPLTLRLGEGGILSLKVNGFAFFLIPAP